MPAVTENNCYVCGSAGAKYRCPGCRQVTCSLPCVNSHKDRTACTGKRPVTHFVPLQYFNQNDMLSDYRFLEQVERSLYGKKKNRIVHSSSIYPVVVDYLRRGAFKRGVKLKFLSLGMQRRSTNSSMFNRKTDKLTWKVDWHFPLSDVTYSDKSVDDATIIEDVLKKYLAAEASDAIRQSLRKYIVNPDSVCVLMANEFTGSQKKYYKVNTKKTLRNFLLGKTIVEYPSFVITLEEFLVRYQLIPETEATALAVLMHERRLSKFCPRKSNSNDYERKNNSQNDGIEGANHSNGHNYESFVKTDYNENDEHGQMNEKIDSTFEAEQMDVTRENKISEDQQCSQLEEKVVDEKGKTSEPLDVEEANQSKSYQTMPFQGKNMDITECLQEQQQKVT